MAKIKAPTMHDRMYVGTHGNLSVAFSKASLSAAAVNTEVELLDVPIGIKVVALRINTDGLGAGVTVDVKLGTKTLKAGIDVATATNQIIALPSAYTDQKAVLMAVIKGAEANGVLEINPEYLSVGY